MNPTGDQRSYYHVCEMKSTLIHYVDYTDQIEHHAPSSELFCSLHQYITGILGLFFKVVPSTTNNFL